MPNTTEKRQAILDTTLRLITSQGFHATPMSQIAKEANVAAGTIYHYFTSKEELISVLYAEVKEKMGAALILGLDPAASFKARFKQFWLNQHAFLLQHPAEFWFLEQYAVSPFIKGEDVEASAQHYQLVIRFLSGGMDDGLLKRMNPDLMAYLLNAQVATVVKLELTGHFAILSKDLNQLVEASWDMVKA